MPPKQKLSPEAQAQIELANEVSNFYGDPLGFVLFAYPWGQGELSGFKGPEKWQKEFLEQLGKEVWKRGFDGIHAVEPIRMARASGHGVGKSTLSAWLVNWIMSTRGDSQGTVTANTYTQLRTKTWAAIQKWSALCITNCWFDISAEKIAHKRRKATWFCQAQTCREETSEAFAGQHAATSTSYYLFDEASSIPDRIWEVAEGGLTDGEPMIFAFGNPTRNQGKFHRITFGGEQNRWKTGSVDSRECSLTNKKQIEQWIQDYGEDSDFVRVRVRGLPPSSGDAQYIGQDLVDAAQRRDPVSLPDDPLIAGIDVSRGGEDETVVRFRQGRDAATRPSVRLTGEESRDSMRVATWITEILNTEYVGKKVDMAFLDGGSMGGPICDRLHQLGYKNVIEIQFGSAAPDFHYANMRAWMWSRMKEWLTKGGAIDRDSRWETDLTAPGYGHDKRDRLLLESKESIKARGLASPDDADALALTFSQTVAVPKRPRRDKDREIEGYRTPSPTGWMA